LTHGEAFPLDLRCRGDVVRDQGIGPRQENPSAVKARQPTGAGQMSRREVFMFGADLKNYRVVDLSYEVVPGELEDRPFDMSLGMLGDDTYRYDITRTHSHVGTHIEAPWHYYKSGKTITDFPVTHFMGRGVLLPFRLPEGQLEISPDYVRKEIGALLREDDIVLFHNAHNKGLRIGRVSDAESQRVPYMTEETAIYLRDHKIKMFGFDILRLGLTTEEGRKMHDIFMSHDVCLIEWLDHLDQLDRREFFFIALPFKVRNMDSSFVRAAAIIET
jgi:arylformamidase